MNAQRVAFVPTTPIDSDGFEALDTCHRQMLGMLDRLAVLVARLKSVGVDDEARVMAADIVDFFSTTSRHHHEDEERYVFPKLATDGDPDLVQAVLRLQQDHVWVEEDWMEIGPPLDAIANGQSWYDLDLLTEQVDIFSALLRDHIALEESFIYPQARAQLGEHQRHAMGREMAARRRAARAAQRA